MKTENVSTLKIHKLTQEQYDRELAAGNIDATALYLTPDEEVDLSGLATKDEVSSTYETKESAQDKLDEAKLYADTGLVNKADKVHNHDTSYDTKGAADTALATAKEYTDTKTANFITSSTVDNKISTHNTSTSAHNDIRDLINGLSTRLNALADSDDETLDQMSEIVEYIKANKALIDSVTTSKVSVSDIIDNLTTNVSNKPLSAAQGVAIKALIDALDAELDSHTHEISDVTNLQSTLDGKASKSVATISSDGLMSAEDKIQLDNGGNPIVTTSGDGAAYTATIDGITALTNGMKITIIPHAVSTTTTPTLNVNGLGAKYIRMPVAYNTGASTGGAIAAWLTKSRPVTLQYNGTYWLTVDLPRPSALYLNGVVPIANGGTGADTAEGALTNLGVTATATELNYMDGVTRNVQEQLNEMFSSTATRTANTVLAAPNGSDGGATFRKLVPYDIPDSKHIKDDIYRDINTIGWYRIYASTSGSWHGDTVKFSLVHGYSYSATEAYDFSVSCGYWHQVDITQLSGVNQGQSITKIRVVRYANDMVYIDFYYTTDVSNPVYVYGTGRGAFQTPTLVESIPDDAYVTEFSTVQGCKSSSGFTGNLNGHANSATDASYAGYANYLNTVAGNEIRINNNTGLTGTDGEMWLGYCWASGDTSVRKNWRLGNFSGGGLANLYLDTLYGNVVGNVNGYASLAGRADSVNAVYVGDVLEFANSCGEGMTLFLTNENSSNLPNYNTWVYRYSSGYVLRRYNNIVVVLYAFNGISTVRNAYDGSSWYGWKYDMSNVLDSDVHYGTSLPAAGTAGRIFFKKV